MKIYSKLSYTLRKMRLKQLAGAFELIALRSEQRKGMKRMQSIMKFIELNDFVENFGKRIFFAKLK